MQINNFKDKLEHASSFGVWYYWQKHYPTKLDISTVKGIFKELPRETFWVYMHTQVGSCFNKLICIGNSKCFLCFSHSFPFDWWSLLQYWRFCYFFVDLKLLRSGGWRWLWAHQCIMHSSKMDKICNEPSYMKLYSLSSSRKQDKTWCPNSSIITVKTL